MVDRKARRKITVEIDNLTEAQDLALRDLFATWVELGGIGGSRWTSFYADGDGDFRPQITVNSEKPEHYGDAAKRWKDGDYLLDFDEIAGSLHNIHKVK